MLLPYTALPSLYSSTELLPRIPAPSELGETAAPPGLAAAVAHRATVELSRRATLTAVVRSSYCSSD
jgi:hypothetical protein